MSYLFTSESVAKGHPDKVSDQVSDALLDEFLRRDPEAKVACETLVTTGLVVLSGEVNTRDYVPVEKFVRETILEIGYNKSSYQFDGKSCAVISAIHPQSVDIHRGVERIKPEEQGAGDQGMMFGYACKDTDDYMPLALDLSHILLQELEQIREEGQIMTYLRPDAKTQVTIEYSDDNVPLRIDTIVVSTQHDEFDTDDSKMLDTIRKDVEANLITRAIQRLPQRVQKLFTADYKLLVNPTGKFVIGGPHGDTGLTGRKIIVDTYGGKGAHGGGAFSGKDASKVDRSAAYAARHIAKNMVAAGVAEEVLVQVAYAIGVAEPVGFYINTYGKSNVALSDGEIAQRVQKLFDMRPYSIIKRFGLKYPIFKETAAYGHVGRKYRKDTVVLKYNGKETTKEVEFFAWEKLDYVEKLRKEFHL